MDPELWGPKLWFFLHTLSFEYNPSIETKKSYSTFFNSLAPIIPCEICRLHYTKFLKNYPIENNLNNKESLIKWVLKCHNNVNKINNKPEWSYNDLMSKYTSIFKNDLYNKLSYKNITIFLFIVILLLILFILIK